MFFYLGKAAWFVLTPSNALPLLAALGLVLAGLPGLARVGQVLAGTALAVLLVAGFGPLGEWLLLPLEDRFPPFRDDGRRIDGIVVLGGAVHPETSLARGQLVIGDAGERILAMADLARRYPGATVIFSGGVGSLRAGDVPEAEVVRRFAGTLGLDPARIVPEDRSRSTAENARFSKDLAAPKPGSRWLLVTSAWHMPRAVASFRAAGFPVVPYPVDYLTGGPADRATIHVELAAGLSLVDLAAKEWLGLVAYRLSGRSDVLLPSP